ncbi:head-tail connector protein [Schinkia azotoformans]|uniref:head-tail connector protein n=1 Tax=Schinkia azotoformans TaxID=1454 RepID=UPI002E213AC2|nr:head-tail connector protein [Schinkia azotoformans]MED4354075.1 head-tail connector protein [Schinkia azotoformans]
MRWYEFSLVPLYFLMGWCNVKISEITTQNIKDYARISFNEDDELISNIMIAVKAYIKSYTGLSDETVDTKEDLSIAFMILCVEMYDNREFTVQKDKVNVVVQSILDLYSVNLL